jgi:O-antigen ligase
MCIIKYTLPLFYLWLGYTAINDEYDLLHFMKTVAIGMCVYALIIGGFSAKFMAPLYGFLNFRSGGLFISYASLADYFSGLVVVPIGLFIFTRNPKWLWATVWVILSTILETVRTGLGGLFLASSFLLFTVYRSKAVPWIAALLIGAVAIVFTVPEFRDKMFVNKNTTYENFSASDANFKNIHSNGREAIWNHLMEKYYYPHKLTGSGIGTSNYDIKNSKNEYFHKVQLIHSDYVQLLCDVGLIGVVLFGIFVLVTLLTITGTAWQRGSPWELKVIGGMALGSCAGTFFSMAYDNVVTYSQQSFVLPFVMIGIYLKIKDLHDAGQWGATDELEIEEEESLREIEN